MNSALITLIVLAVLYILDINFPLHRYNLWRVSLRKIHVAPHVKSKRNTYVIKSKKVEVPKLKSHKGPKFTPDLSIGKVAVVSDNFVRINNFITNVLKDDPHSLKYMKVACASKVSSLLEHRVKQVHLIYGYDNLAGIETVLDSMMSVPDMCNFYSDQLYMEI